MSRCERKEEALLECEKEVEEEEEEEEFEGVSCWRDTNRLCAFNVWRSCCQGDGLERGLQFSTREGAVHSERESRGAR